MSLSHQAVLRHLQGVTSNADSTPEAIAEQIRRFGAPVGSAIEHHGQLPRCMVRLRELIDRAERQQTSLPNGTVVISDTLSTSNGRFKRQWFAPPGGLWLALAWADTLLPEFAALLPMAAGIACCEAVRLSGVPGNLKWVNDVLVGNCKVCGILCESMVSEQGERYHLIGIGINVNNRSFPHELTTIATSICNYLGREIDLYDFTLDLLAQLAWNIGMLHYQEACHLACQADSDSSLTVVGRWLQLSDMLGRQVMYGYDVQQKPLYRAQVVDLDPGGGLHLKLEDGTSTIVYSGELQYL